MRQVAIIADSVATVPPEVAKEYDISLVPFHIVMDGTDYLDTTIDKEQLYARIRSKENLPTTSPPSPAEFLEFFKRASQQAKAILVVTITSGYSQAYNAALNAKKLAQEQLPNTTIEVLDSQTVVGGEMLITIEAAKAASEGKSLAEVIEVANNIKQRVSEFALRPSLFHFEHYGRTGKAKGWAKSAISTVTVLETDAATGGAAKPVLRDRKPAKAVEATLDLIEERTKGKRLHAAITHVSVPDEAERLKKKLLSRFDLADEIHVCEMPPIGAVLNGEGIVEIGFYAED